MIGVVRQKYNRNKVEKKAEKNLRLQDRRQTFFIRSGSTQGTPIWTDSSCTVCATQQTTDFTEISNTLVL